MDVYAFFLTAVTVVLHYATHVYHNKNITSWILLLCLQLMSKICFIHFALVYVNPWKV